MCWTWDMAIGTPSLLPLYVPFEHLEKFGIRSGPPATFWDNVPYFCFFFFLKASLRSFIVISCRIRVRFLVVNYPNSICWKRKLVSPHILNHKKFTFKSIKKRDIFEIHTDFNFNWIFPYKPWYPSSYNQ